MTKPDVTTGIGNHFDGGSRYFCKLINTTSYYLESAGVPYIDVPSQVDVRNWALADIQPYLWHYHLAANKHMFANDHCYLKQQKS